MNGLSAKVSKLKKKEYIFVFNKIKKWHFYIQFITCRDICRLIIRFSIDRLNILLIGADSINTILLASNRTFNSGVDVNNSYLSNIYLIKLNTVEAVHAIPQWSSKAVGISRMLGLVWI